jgi:hypothetical protein
MSIASFKAYIRDTFFKEHSPQWFTYIILFFLVILLEIVAVIYKSFVLLKVAGHLLAITIVYMIFHFVRMHYRLYRMFECDRSTIAENIDEVKSIVPSNVLACIKELHERVEKLEQYRSPYIPLILIYLICIGIAILIPLLFRALPR